MKKCLNFIFLAEELKDLGKDNYRRLFQRFQRFPNQLAHPHRHERDPHHPSFIQTLQVITINSSFFLYCNNSIRLLEKHFIEILNYSL